MFEDLSGKITIGIIDDMKSDAEKAIRDLKRIFLLPWFSNIEYEWKYYNSGETFLESDEEYHIIFLDVEMPGGIDGFETARRLVNRRRKPIIIFLTTHDTRGAEGYPVGAFRFLSKIFNETEYAEALKAAIEKIYTNQRIIVQHKDEYGEELVTERIYLDEITHLEANGKESFIYTKFEKFTSNKLLKYWEELLPPDRFYKLSKFYVINFENVVDIDLKEECVYFDSELVEKISAAREQKKKAHKAMHDFFRSRRGLDD